jgi:LCP family protein required for cell wall assembly
VLWVASWLVLALGLFWAFLILNAWWAARPRDMGALRAGILGGIALVLAGTVAYGTVFISSALRSSGNAFSTVLGGGGDTKVKAGRYNILLLGSDAGNDRTGARTDSVSVASVDARTGRTVLFGLPRNLEDVPFIDSSPLKKLYPNGYSCPTHECMLNAVYTLAWDHKALYPGVKDPGLQAVKEAVEAITGLEINYYAMVDMFGFKDLIDALGGVHMDINIAVPVGGDTSSAKSWIQPGPNRTLTGAEALWFARERKESTDYARMQRQKCVMSAMLHQMDPLTVATKFGQIASASGQVLAGRSRDQGSVLGHRQRVVRAAAHRAWQPQLRPHPSDRRRADCGLGGSGQGAGKLHGPDLRRPNLRRPQRRGVDDGTQHQPHGCEEADRRGVGDDSDRRSVERVRRALRLAFWGCGPQASMSRTRGPTRDPYSSMLLLMSS